MKLHDKITEMFDKWKGELLILTLLIGFGFFINQGVEIKGLYMDDLYLWSCYGEQSFVEYVLPKGGTRFRFIFYLASWLELFFIGSHIELMVPFNIVLNGLIAYSIYRIAARMSGRKVVSFLTAVAYLLSRFAYYQIGQLYGLMESLALWTALGMLYYIWRYMKDRDTKAYVLACLLYFTASFVHERYMVLVLVLFLGLLLGSRKKTYGMDMYAGEPEAEEENGQEITENLKSGRSRGKSRGRRMEKNSSVAFEKTVPKWVLFLATLLLFGLIQLIRFTMIGTLSPAGTGGTDVADTFEISEAIGNAWNQVAFVFGRNSGPDYLCGQTFEESPAEIVRLIGMSNLVLAAAVLVFIGFCLIRDRERIGYHLKNVILFLSFIALCIGSSSVTIRVEMRWVYVAYAAALLFLAYMSSIMGKAAFLIPLYVALIFPVETYYRETWDNIYLWPPQKQYNSLAEETFEKYGDEIFDKQVYIIGNNYEMSEFYAETFLKVYDTDREAANTTIQFIDSDFDFKEIPENAVILWEDEANHAYQDVTEFVKLQRRNYVYGSYPDGWIDENAKIVMMNGNKDVLKLGCYYPREITGNEVCKIKVNGKSMPDLVFTDNYMTYEIPSAPYQMLTLEFSCNFYVKDAKEKRGEENMAMVVTLGKE